MLYFHQGGHGGAPPDVFINLWFTRYLFGVHNGVERLPRAWIVREPNACPVRRPRLRATIEHRDAHRRRLGPAHSRPHAEHPGHRGRRHGTNGYRNIVGIVDSTHVILSAPVATGAGEKVADGATIALLCATRLNPVPYAEWPVPGTEPSACSSPQARRESVA